MFERVKKGRRKSREIFPFSIIKLRCGLKYDLNSEGRCNAYGILYLLGRKKLCYWFSVCMMFRLQLKERKKFKEDKKEVESFEEYFIIRFNWISVCHFCNKKMLLRLKYVWTRRLRRFYRNNSHNKQRNRSKIYLEMIRNRSESNLEYEIFHRSFGLNVLVVVIGTHGKFHIQSLFQIDLRSCYASKKVLEQNRKWNTFFVKRSWKWNSIFFTFSFSIFHLHQ